MRTSFWTGFALILPLVVTFMIFTLMVDVITGPFLLPVESALHLSFLAQYVNNEVLRLLAKLIVLILFLGFTLLIGRLAHLFLVRYFLQVSDAILHRIPLVNPIYRATKEIVHTVFDPNRKTFSRVVLIPFPDPKSLAVAFVISDGLDQRSDPDKRELISLFLPAAPNPTIGFILLCPPNEVIATGMKVEEAIKFIISCGTMFDGFRLSPSA